MVYAIFEVVLMIADKIKKYRKAKKLTQKDLASLVGVSTGYIQMLELRKKNNPSMEVLAKISDALHVSIEDLIEDENPMRKIKKEIDKLKLRIYQINTDLEKYENIYKKELQDSKLNESDIELKENLNRIENECNKLEEFKMVAESELDFLYEKLKKLLSKADTYEEFGDFFIDEKEKEEGKKLLEERISIYSDIKRNQLLTSFEKLNEAGKEEAVKRVDELTQIKKYTRDETIVINYEETE